MVPPRPPLAWLLVLCALPALAGTGCRGSRAPSPALPLTGAPSLAAGDGDVALLSHPDFARRSAAAERLVAAGAQSLPALGARGDQAAAGLDGQPESTTGPVIAAILARLSDDEVGGQLGSPHPVLRREAADELGRRGSWTPIPTLIERLDDRVPAVREAAHEALRRITGEFLATGSGAPGALPASRAERWRTWWREAGRARAAEPENAPG